MFLVVWLIKLSVLIINLVKMLSCTEGENVVFKFINRIFKEYGYCRSVIKKHFNKNLIMTAKENEAFERSNICWICGKLIDFNDKVRDHCHITGKYRGLEDCSCNINLKLVKKFL